MKYPHGDEGYLLIDKDYKCGIVSDDPRCNFCTECDGCSEAMMPVLINGERRFC